MNSNQPRNGRTEESLSSTVVRAVAAYSNEPPESLPPLNEAVDTDALDALFAPRVDGTPRSAGTVVFPYAGFEVTVSADGSIDLEPLDRPGN